ncbi:MAG TPA: DUF4236 domain-containing protein [Acetobacteraceae bacterium]
MPLRFRRTVRILPGLRLNASKSGLSVSAGRRGANVTVGHGRTRTTVGVPGTGLSYTTTTPTRRKRAPAATWGQRLLGVAVLLAIIWWMGWL